MNFEIKDVIYAIQKFIQEHMVFNVSTPYAPVRSGVLLILTLLIIYLITNYAR